MTPALDYLAACEGLIARVRAQQPQIGQAADWFAQTILARADGACLRQRAQPHHGGGDVAALRVVPGLQSDRRTVAHVSQSRRGRERAAAGDVPRECSGLAERILRNFDLKEGDSALVISSSGCNVVPIEMAEEFQRRGVRVVAIISQATAKPARAGIATERSCRTSPSWCSTPARPWVTRWCGSKDSTRRWRRVRRSAAV